MLAGEHSMGRESLFTGIILLGEVERELTVSAHFPDRSLVFYVDFVTPSSFA